MCIPPDWWRREGDLGVSVWLEYSRVAKQELILELILGVQNVRFTLLKLNWGQHSIEFAFPRQLGEVAKKCVEPG